MTKRDSSYTSVLDASFQRTLTLADAYRNLERFVVQYNARGESSTVSLMSDIGLGSDSTSSDPAQLDDFLRVADEVLGQKPDRTPNDT